MDPLKYIYNRVWIWIISAIAFLPLFSCENKELYYGPREGQEVAIVIHWDDNQLKPAQGMRVNIFSLNDSPHYGISDMSSTGGKVKLGYNTSHLALCYDYFESANIYFRNETHSERIEACCASWVRASYTRAFPDENTVAEPGVFFVDKVSPFEVTRSDTVLVLHFYPQNVSKTYTFRIHGVKGAEYITSTRGAVSGMSASYFPATETLAPTPSTLLFDARADGENDCIEGSFRTFGRVGDNNWFNMEILYPSTEGVLSKSWEVTEKLDEAENSGTYHFEIEDADITIVPDSTGGGGSGGGGFNADLNEWKDESVPVHI
jgi:hypothetical protein